MTIMTKESDNRKPRALFAVAIAAVLVFSAIANATTGLHFPGGNSYASTPDASTFDFNGSFTIDVWFLSPNPHTGTLVAKFRQASGTPTDDSYHIYVRDDDTLQARIQTTTQLVDLKAGGVLHDGQWHHTALVFNEPSDRAELYLDGALGAWQTLTGNLRDTGERVTLGAVLTGSGTPTPTSFFVGSIDELRFWNTARTGEQAWCLKDVTLLHDTPGLVSYYRFDETSGATAGDAIPPYESFTLFSGAVFTSAEPPLRSRLFGPGQCRCGDVSGVYDVSDPALTLVGDTITIPAGDSLVIASHALTVDSSVAFVSVLGTFRTIGTISDSAFLLGQGSPAADGFIQISNPAAASLQFTRVSGFAAVPLRFEHVVNIANCSFANNSGGVLSGQVGITITDCIFTDNGGTSVSAVDGSLSILRSAFRRNVNAISITGGITTIDSAIFEENTTTGSGAAISATIDDFSKIRIENSQFRDNQAANGGAISIRGQLIAGGDSLILAQCEFVANRADSGSAIFATNIHLLAERCDFDSNAAIFGTVALQADGNHIARIRGDSLHFSHNEAAGAAIALRGTVNAPVELQMTGSTFSDNRRSPLAEGATIIGEYVRPFSAGYPVLNRCLLHDNLNAGGGASAIDFRNAYGGSSIELRSLTVVLNSADSAAVRMNVPSMLRNCIVIENGGVREIMTNSAVAYCLTSDSEFHGAGGSFYSDPLFADFWNRDFRLTAGSPAINRGDPNALYNDVDGTRADIGSFAVAACPPVWQSISDVPHDNGRNLMLEWLPSAGDDARQGITSYTVWRVVNLARLDESYEWMATVPAAQLPGYGLIVPTLADSNANGVPFYTYLIRAQSANPLAFWDSPLDSGYSVDNLSPQTPVLNGQQVPGGAVLAWTAANDSDAIGYLIYRSETFFDPDTMTTALASVIDTTYFDSVEFGSFYYAVRSVDRNGNLSDASNVVSVDITLLTPTELTITPLNGSLWLHWEPVSGATYYYVYRAPALGAVETLVDVTANTSCLTPIVYPRAVYWVTAVRE